MHITLRNVEDFAEELKRETTTQTSDMLDLTKRAQIAALTDT